MNAMIIYDNDGYFELVESVRETAKAHNGTFTADDMLNALQAKADASKNNDNLNARRIRATLATLSSHMGSFEITENPSGVYEYSR